MSSLKEQLAARREQLQQERTFVLPLLGYEDLGLHVRYKVLPYEALRKIGQRHERSQNTPEGEVAVAAETLVRACVGLLRKDEDGSFHELDALWTPKSVRELFGFDLPPEASSADALQAVLPSMQLVLHAAEYSEQATSTLLAVDEEMVGESEPSVEG